MICTSWSWPNMFDVSRNKVALYEDTRSIINRVKLLLLTDPTEMYMTPNFGVGLKKYLFLYNRDNVPAMIRDELIEQLRLWEPSVIPEETKVERKQSGAVDITNPELVRDKVSKLDLTITLVTGNMNTISFGVSDSDINIRG